MDGEEAILGERLERLADWRAPEREPVRQAAFGLRLVGSKLAGDDEVPEQAIGAVAIERGSWHN
jgi:hypothetical protein